jgi:tetratricopeptide (TPR) repeat protein
MKITNNQKLLNEILNTEDQYPMLALQMEISSKKNTKKLENAKEAVALYTKILKTKKTSLIYFYRAINYSTLHENNNAIADYTIAIKLNKKHSSAYTNRGMCYFELCEYKKAVKDFSASLKLGTDYMTFLSRAESYFHLNKFKEANEDFQSAIKLKDESELSLKGPSKKR